MVKRRLLTLLSIVSVAATVAATLMVFAQDRLFDADDFATTLGSTLREPEVNDYLADEVSAALIDQLPNLAVSGPLLADVTGAVLESDTAIGIVEAAARQAHRVVFDGGEDTLVLELSDLVVSVQLALEAINPELANSPPTAGPMVAPIVYAVVMRPRLCARSTSLLAHDVAATAWATKKACWRAVGSLLAKSMRIVWARLKIQ